MTLTQVKAMAAKVAMAGLVAGVLAVAGPATAQAQAFSFGVQVGGPHVGYAPGFVAAPGYAAGYAAGPGFYPRQRWEREEAFERQQAFLRQQEIVRHEQWERSHRSGYGFYGR